MNRRSRQADPNQLPIDWTTACAPPPPPPPAGTGTFSPTASEHATPSEPALLVQRLPWDFTTSFPEPLPEAIDAGTLDESDATPDGLRTLHAAHAEVALATLRERDGLFEARRSGVDPGSGRRPTIAAGRERLRECLREVPERQQHAFDVLMMTYADAFGLDAADAFTKALIAWHANIDVVADVAFRPNGRQLPASAPGYAEDLSRGAGRRRSHRSSTALPVPRPLRSAVQSGVFGHDEAGPVYPSSDEVRVITEQHAERLAELLMGVRGSQPSARSAEAFEAGITAYAVDFGTPAAERLRSHVEKLVARQQREFVRRTL